MPPRDGRPGSELVQKLDSLGLALRGCSQLCVHGEQERPEVVLMEASAILDLIAGAVDEIIDDIDDPRDRRR
jgi:hypothetical protein